MSFSSSNVVPSFVNSFSFKATVSFTSSSVWPPSKPNSSDSIISVFGGSLVSFASEDLVWISDCLTTSCISNLECSQTSATESVFDNSSGFKTKSSVFSDPGSIVTDFPSSSFWESFSNSSSSNWSCCTSVSPSPGFSLMADSSDLTSESNSLSRARTFSVSKEPVKVSSNWFASSECFINSVFITSLSKSFCSFPASLSSIYSNSNFSASDVSNATFPKVWSFSFDSSGTCSSRPVSSTVTASSSVLLESCFVVSETPSVSSCLSVCKISALMAWLSLSINCSVRCFTSSLLSSIWVLSLETSADLNSGILGSFFSSCWHTDSSLVSDTDITLSFNSVISGSTASCMPSFTTKVEPSISFSRGPSAFPFSISNLIKGSDISSGTALCTSALSSLITSDFGTASIIADNSCISSVFTASFVASMWYSVSFSSLK